mmetsp:Transcript_15458/g.32950  ORF Transcript_15458/g.32950 Transcript_15458/m.32950 type:complete len:400 (+) Transcript_15458:521-1720(+)
MDSAMDCTMPLPWENCLNTKCCIYPGIYTCYQKTPHFAQCRNNGCVFQAEASQLFFTLTQIPRCGKSRVVSRCSCLLPAACMLYFEHESSLHSSACRCPDDGSWMCTVLSTLPPAAPPAPPPCTALWGRKTRLYAPDWCNVAEERRHSQEACEDAYMALDGGVVMPCVKERGACVVTHVELHCGPTPPLPPSSPSPPAVPSQPASPPMPPLLPEILALPSPPVSMKPLRSPHPAPSPQPLPLAPAVSTKAAAGVPPMTPNNRDIESWASPPGSAVSLAPAADEKPELSVSFADVMKWVAASLLVFFIGLCATCALLQRACCCLFRSRSVENNQLIEESRAPVSKSASQLTSEVENGGDDERIQPVKVDKKRKKMRAEEFPESTVELAHCSEPDHTSFVL